MADFWLHFTTILLTWVNDRLQRQYTPPAFEKILYVCTLSRFSCDEGCSIAAGVIAATVVAAAAAIT